MVLAVPAALLGFVGAPELFGFNGAFFDWVFSGAARRSASSACRSLLLSIALVAIGAGARVPAVRGRTGSGTRCDRLGAVYTALEHRLLHRRLLPAGHRPADAVTGLSSADRTGSTSNVIDGVVNGAALAARGLAMVVNLFDREVIDGAVNGVGTAQARRGGLLRYLQSGNVQRYAVFLFAASSRSPSSSPSVT